MIRAAWEVAWSALDGLALYPLRTLATLGAVTGVLFPYLVGMSISTGLREETEKSLERGPDLYVRAERFGREAPLPGRMASEIAQLAGVREATPRIVGSLTLGGAPEPAVVVGLPEELLEHSITRIEGRAPRSGSVNELVVGAELARRLRLKVGATLPPFYRSRSGERVSRVVGVFRSGPPFWESRVILTSLATAQHLFDQPGQVTEVLVRCEPGKTREAALRIADLERRGVLTDAHLWITPREVYQGALPGSFLHREGVFNLHFVLAFSVGIGLVLVTSGVGLAERKREIAILKATGWPTDAVLLRSAVESLLLSVAALFCSVLICYLWLRFMNGWALAPLFIAGLEPESRVPVPYRIPLSLVGVSGLVSFAVVAVGSAWSTWCASGSPPLQALR